LPSSAAIRPNESSSPIAKRADRGTFGDASYVVHFSHEWNLPTAAVEQRLFPTSVPDRP
jgi:hypothetical protein